MRRRPSAAAPAGGGRMRLLPLCACLCATLVRPSSAPRVCEIERDYADELLKPIFDWNAALPSATRYLSNITHAMLRTRNGTVMVHSIDTPKEREPAAGHSDAGLLLGDAVLVVPDGSASPSMALLEVALDADRAGTNRIHLFAMCTGEVCTTTAHSAVTWNMTNGTNTSWTENWSVTTCVPGYDDPGNAISVVLAPQNDPSAVRRTVDLQMPDFVAHTGEWHAVLGDFFVLPAEMTGAGRLRLFVKLGSEHATLGHCALTDLTLTTIVPSNVALLKAVTGTESQAHTGGDVPSNQILTNSETNSNPGQMWYRFDTSYSPTFVLDLQWKHHICNTRIEFNKAGRIWDWSLYVQNETTAAGEEDTFHEILRVTDAAWSDWTEDGQGSLDSPISTEARWFDCTDVYKAKVVLHGTKNIIYTLTEIELGGYDTQVDAICTLGCRHGGHCFNVQHTCRCVSKWGWRGTRCDADADECGLVPRDSSMFGNVDADSSGGISQAEFNRYAVSTLNVSMGTPGCSGCWNDMQCLTDDNDNDLVTSAEFASFQIVGNVTYNGPVAAAEIGVSGQNGGCGLGNSLSSRFDKASCTNTPGSWECRCNPGFAGDPSTGGSNNCVDINECTLDDKGGCEHVCVNSQGSYRCACRNGYALREGSLTRCAPVCGKKCLNGGSCMLPDQCLGCDDGWQGSYCDEPKCAIRVIAEDGSEVTGCYHNGFCGDADGCRDCNGGWSGDNCGTVDGGFIVLIAGLLSALPALACLIVVTIKRKWLPFQERGSLLMILGCVGTTLFLATVPAISNPGIFPIALKFCEDLAATECVEDENPMWGRLMPFGLGFGIWFNCVLIRMRNLVHIHLKGKVPFAAVIQIAILTGIWAVVSILPDEVANVACLLVSVVFLCYFALMAIQLLPLRKQITDVLPHFLCGSLAGLAHIALLVLRMAGMSYANPGGGINVVPPLVMIGVIDLHLFLTVVRLVIKLIRKDKGIMEQYAEGGEEDDTAQSRWKKGLRSAKIGVIIKLNTEEDEGAAKAGRKGGLLGLLKGKGADGENSDSEEDTPSEESEESEESESSESESSSSSGEEAAIVGGRGGRGRGRGRSRGRGRWSRASRARARQLTSSSPHVQSKSGAGGAKPSQVRTAALLFQAVSAKAAVSVPGTADTSGNFETFAPQSSEESDTDSDDSELLALEQEVSRFEGLLANKIEKVNKQTGEKYVPRDAPFHGSEMGSGFQARMGLDMQLKQRVVEKELQPLYDPSDDVAPGEMSELQKTTAELKKLEAEPSDSDSDSEDDGFDFSDCEYSVEITTGSDSNAGTTANVWIDIVGDHGDTGEVILRNADIPTPFLPGQRDTFMIMWPDLGALRKVRIGHDKAGVGASWLLGSVKVQNAKNGQALTFSVGKWIDESGKPLILE